MELAGPADAPLDEPLALRARGGASDVTWRARLRDDDGRVWRATADTVAGLDAAWAPAKTPAAPHAALQSLRPAQVEVRAEAASGAAASRTVTRRLLADGVRVRRWRAPAAASLFLPAEPQGAAVLVEDPDALLAAALLASRGILTLVLRGGEVTAAREQLAAVPGAAEPRVLPALPLPPGVPAVPAADPAAWDALLAELGARPRQAADGAGSG